MKAFATVALVMASAAVVTAQQPTYNTTSGKYDCPVANAVYCAGDSLGTNIIIRCDGLVGQPGNCNDNLAGQFPTGVLPAQCWASSTTPGVAACAKNCVVYGDSGNYNGTFTLPGCTPSTTKTTSTAQPTTTSVTSTVTSTTATITSTTQTGATGTSGGSDSTITDVETFTTTICDATGVPTTTLTSTIRAPCYSCGHSNSTIPYGTGSATATPVGPTKSSNPQPTFAPSSGNANKAGVAVAMMGLVAAYFL